MTYKTLTRSLGLLVMTLLMGGWGLAAHAQVCTSANCMIQMERAYDPAYQAAVHGGWPYHPQYGSYQYPYSYSYPSTYSSSYGMYPYSSYPYNSQYQYSYNQDYPYQQDYQYQYQYQYQYSNQYPYPQQQRNSYWQNGCLITTIQTNGVVQTTRACG